MDRFYAKLVPNPENGCLEWHGWADRNGYGRIKINGKGVYTHRLAYELAVGPIGDFKVLHKCDNPACCNPDHLFLGTLKENMQDMVKKGRNYVCSGSRHGLSKLTEAQVLEIRDKTAQGASQASLARFYGVSAASINKIVRRRVWTHI